MKLVYIRQDDEWYEPTMHVDIYTDIDELELYYNDSKTNE